ncbi:hypothetical protein [Variovorax rhizosphaerae]|uniref:DUF4148 domain-containing protein n=1 Tax=Variovorax rhizosphaerae TaxID=1836200 RepID=A0ABU8WIP6_9BURK
MQPVFRTLSLLLAAACAPALAAHEIVVGERAHRGELRGAVEADLAARVAQVRTEDAMAGRHLNPAERLELRQQLRRQWSESASASPSRTVESQAAGRVSAPSAFAPTATPIADAQPARALSGTVRSQRP